MRSTLPLLLALAACAPASEDWTPRGAAFEATLRGGGLARVSADESRLDGLRLRFSAFGRPGALQPVALSAPRERALAPGLSRVELEQPGLLSWWQTRGDGLQQGWIVDRAPAGEGPLLFRTEVEGALPEALGEGVRLVGDHIWEVSGLAARDATGRALPASIHAREGALLVRVDDRDARYPIWVDPLYAAVAVGLPGPSTNSGFGLALARLGDIDGDGFADFAVGAPRVNAVYVYRGGATGPNPADALVWTGTGAFGTSVDGEFDLNCDGRDDMIIGAPAAGGTGAIYVYPGVAAGLGASELLTATGPTSNAYVGYAVAGLGDFDGDGCEDVAVGAPGVSSGAGAAGIQFGDSPAPNSGDTILFFNNTPGDAMGYSIAGPGDLNGDGYADLAIGACYGADATGSFTVQYGAPGRLNTLSTPTAGDELDAELGCPLQGAGDLNSDGRADLAVAAPGADGGTGEVRLYLGAGGGLGASAGQTLTGDTAGEGFGTGVDGGGDINGDGYGDLVVGAPSASGGLGRVELYPGRPGGVSAPSSIEGTVPAGSFGSQVLIAGDVNGDGYADLAIAAPGESNATGMVYVYFGGADEDGDGVPATEDCDDTDAGVTTQVLSYPDEDVDGYGDDSISELGCTIRTGWVTQSGDCNDQSRAIHPGADEVIADGVDQDCDGQELCYIDADGDGSRLNTTVLSPDAACDGAGEALASTPAEDCDDADPTVYPGAPETWYDGVDADCAGDDDYDQDHDLFPTNVAPPDCDDTDPAVYPGAPEPPGTERDCEAQLASLSGGCGGCGGGGSPGLALALLALAITRRSQLPSAKNFFRPRPA